MINNYSIAPKFRMKNLLLLVLFFTLANNLQAAKVCNSNQIVLPTDSPATAPMQLPSITVSTNLIKDTITFCGDSLIVPITISNTGTSNLTLSARALGNDDTIRILGLTNGCYQSAYDSILIIINSFYPRSKIYNQNISTAATLQSALMNKDIVLVPFLSSDKSSIYSLFASTLQSFVNNGGTIIFAGQTYAGVVFNTGLLSGTMPSYSNSQIVNVINNSSTITSGFPNSFTNYSSFSNTIITNTDIVKLVLRNTNYSIVCYRYYGNGLVINLSNFFEYKNITYYENKVLGNSIKFAAENKPPGWLDLSYSYMTVLPGNSVQLDLTLKTNNVDTGWHYCKLRLLTNDTLNPTIYIPCSLYVKNVMSNAVNLGNDTVVCGSHTLNAGGHNTYLWSTGSTSQTITVTNGGYYSVTVTNNSVCKDRDSILVMVQALPTVNFSGLPSNLCESDAQQSLAGSPTGGVFSGQGVSGNSFNPAISGAGVFSISYQYTDTNGCSNTKIKNTQVHSLPNVQISGLSSSYCTNSSAASLTGSPSGGVFSGAGLNNNQFSPAVAGVGTHSLFYTYNDGYCSNTDTVFTTVFQPAMANITGLDTSYCNNQSLIPLQSVYPGGVFKVDGIVKTVFDPIQLSLGQHIVSYMLTDSNACVCGDTQQVQIYPSPAAVEITSPLSGEYCAGSTSLNLTAQPTGGIFSGQGVVGNTFYTAQATDGVNSISYKLFNTYSCYSEDTVGILVHSPSAQLGADTAVCASTTLPLTAKAGYVSYLWNTGQNSQSISIDSSGVGIGSKIVWCKVQDSYSCESTDSISISFVNCAGFEPTSKQSNLSLYPNPSRKEVEIQGIEETGIIEIILTDLNGKILIREQIEKTESNQTVRMNLQNLSSGLYMLEIRTPQNRSLLKVSKMD